MNHIKLFENFEEQIQLSEIKETCKEILYPLSDDGIEYKVIFKDTLEIYFIDDIIPNNYKNVFKSLFKYMTNLKFKINSYYDMNEPNSDILLCPNCESNDIEVSKNIDSNNHDYNTYEEDLMICNDCEYEEERNQFFSNNVTIESNSLIEIKEELSELTIEFYK